MLLLQLHLSLPANSGSKTAKVRTRLLPRKHAVHDRLLCPLWPPCASQAHLQQGKAPFFGGIFRLARVDNLLCRWAKEDDSDTSVCYYSGGSAGDLSSGVLSGWDNDVTVWREHAFARWSFAVAHLSRGWNGICNTLVVTWSEQFSCCQLSGLKHVVWYQTEELLRIEPSS